MLDSERLYSIISLSFVLTDARSFSPKDEENFKKFTLKQFKNTVKYHEDIKQFESGIPWLHGSLSRDLPHN